MRVSAAVCQVVRDGAPMPSSRQVAATTFEELRGGYPRLVSLALERLYGWDNGESKLAGQSWCWWFLPLTSSAPLPYTAMYSL